MEKGKRKFVVWFKCSTSLAAEFFSLRRLLESSRFLNTPRVLYEMNSKRSSSSHAAMATQSELIL